MVGLPFELPSIGSCRNVTHSMRLKLTKQPVTLVAGTIAAPDMLRSLTRFYLPC